MSKQDFIIIMRLLKSFYLDWAFDIDNKIVVETWYQYLQGMGFEKLKKVVNFYISKHNSAPNNPRELLIAEVEYDMKQMISIGEQ